jgi:hypothetical protein
MAVVEGLANVFQAFMTTPANPSSSRSWRTKDFYPPTPEAAWSGDTADTADQSTPSESFRKQGRGSQYADCGEVVVAVDVEEHPESYSLWLDVPGLLKSDVKVLSSASSFNLFWLGPQPRLRIVCFSNPLTQRSCLSFPHLSWPGLHPSPSTAFT